MEIEYVGFSKKARLVAVGVGGELVALAVQFGGVTRSSAQAAAPESKAFACPADNGGISLPKGFCATIFADNVGHARQLVVAPDGTVYVKRGAASITTTTPVPPGGFLWR